MTAIKHALRHPFISATGLASFIHSTWALATLFGGNPPQGILSLELVAKLAYWLIPAMLIAFALDVGQISTSAQIHKGRGNYGAYLTFVIFAIGNYFLQWLYMAHHMPDLALAKGVRAEWVDLAGLLRDASLWGIPALLPLSTLLYTLSEDEQDTRVIEIKPVVAPLPELPIAPFAPLELEFSGITEQLDESFTATCDQCDWQGSYPTAYSAKQAKVAHSRSHKPVIHKNGHKEGV